MKYILGCTSKIPYFSQNEAKHVSRNTSHNSEIYHCKNILFGKEHWHVTSIPKGVFKKLKRERERNYESN